MLTHKNIGSNTKTLSEYWNFHEDDCLLHALPIYHVHGLFVALGCSLLSGSKVHWMDSFDSEKVIQALSKMHSYDGCANLLYKTLIFRKFKQR